jgi:hypothetical protein
MVKTKSKGINTISPFAWEVLRAKKDLIHRLTILTFEIDDGETGNGRIFFTIPAVFTTNLKRLDNECGRAEIGNPGYFFVCSQLIIRFLRTRFQKDHHSLFILILN